MKSRSHQGRSIRPEPPPPRTAARCENPAARPAAKATAGFDLPPLLLLDLRDGSNSLAVMTVVGASGHLRRDD